MNLKKLIEIARRQGLNPMVHENHRMPMTRRDLVAQGFTYGTSMVMAPSMLSLLSDKAYADDGKCAASADDASGGKIPVIVFDAAGGMNIAGSNVMVGDKGGQKSYLDAAAYGRLGLPKAMGENIVVNEEFGLAFHEKSALLQGLLSSTTPETRALVNGVVFCATSADDTNMNPHNPAYYIANYAGTASVATLLGSDNTKNGGRSISDPASDIPALSATLVSSYAQARDLVSAQFLDTLAPGQVEKILKAATNMSNLQLQKFAAQDLPEQYKTLVECGYISATSSGGGALADSVDASKFADLQNILNLANPNPGNFQIDRNINNNARVLAPAYMALKGFARSATVTFGGRDYHNNPRQTVTDQRDFEYGRSAGLVLEMARRMGKPVCLYFYTDGGVSCSDSENVDASGKPMWSSDSGERSAQFMLVLGKTARPALTDVGHQIGAFRKGSGGVDTDAAKEIANSVTVLVKAFVLNYLALHGDEGKLKEVVKDVPFDPKFYQAFTKVV